MTCVKTQRLPQENISIWMLRAYLRGRRNVEATTEESHTVVSTGTTGQPRSTYAEIPRASNDRKGRQRVSIIVGMKLEKSQERLLKHIKDMGGS